MSCWHCWSYSDILYPTNLSDELKYSQKNISIIFLRLNMFRFQSAHQKKQPYRAGLVRPKFTLLGDDL